MRSPRDRTLAAAAAAALLALTGCGEDAPPADATRATEPWQQTDPCTLLDAEQVAGLIGPGAVAVDATADPERPACAWRVGESPQQLELRLWEPPIPEALTEHATRTTEVGEHTGWVESESQGFCNLHVQAEPAWLTVDLNVPFDMFEPQLCDTAAAAAERALAEVG